MYKRIRHTLSDNTVSALALQIQAVALAYAAHAQVQSWVERTDNNTDDFIQKLWACYAPGRSIDKTKSGAYNNAYCVVGASIIINDAVECLRKINAGAVNLLPNYAATYGNALTLRNKARTISKFHSDTTPTVGALFYRKSDGSASGHCGIIVGVEYDANNDLTLIRTVESNASLSGAKTQYGFLVVEYTPASASWIGNSEAQWEVIHTEEMFTASAPVACTTSCLSIAIPPLSAPKTEPVRTDDGSNTVSRRGQRDTTPPTGGGDGNTTTRREQRDPLPPACRDKYVYVSCCDSAGKTALKQSPEPNLRHYSALRDRRTAIDYVQLEYRPEKPFRMVTDRMGNRFIIAVESVNETWNTPRELGVFGNYVVIPFSRTQVGFTGSNSDDGMGAFLGTGIQSARIVEVMRSEFIRFHSLRANTMSVLNTDGPGFVDRLMKPDTPDGVLRDIAEILWSSDVYTFGDVMRKIEEYADRRKSAYKNNFVFLFTGEPQNFAAGLANAVDTAAPLLLGALSMAGIAISSTTQALLKSVLPNVLRGNFSPSDAGVLVEIGGSVLPQEYSGITKQTQRVLQSFGSKREFGTEQGQEVLNLLRSVDSTLGIGLSERTDAIINNVKTQIRSVELLYANAAAEIERVATSVRGDIAKTAQVFSNALTVQNMTGLLSLGDVFGDPNWVGKHLYTEILSKGRNLTASFLPDAIIVSDPRVRELFLTTNNINALATVPGAHAIIKGLMQIETVSRSMITNAAEQYAWSAIAMGNRVYEDALTRVQLDALMLKAIEFKDRGWRFTLPSIFAGEKRECLEREVKICTGIECCPPKKLVNGVCIEPTADTPPDTPKTPPDTPKTPPNRSVLPPRWGNPPVIDVPRPPDTPTPPEPPMSLPTCIRKSGTGFVYCPPTSCAVRVSGVVTAQSPTQVSPVSSTPTATPTVRTSVMPVQNSAVVAVPTAPIQPFSPVSSTPTVTPTIPSTQFLFRQPDVVYAPTLSDSTCYPARVVYHGTPMEVWFAKIGDRWIEIVDCCPAQQDNCCDDNSARMDRIEERISKLYELLMRNEAGEKNSAVDYNALRTELLTLRTFVENQNRSSTTYDDAPLRNELRRLETLITQLQQNRTQQQSAYNDTELRNRTAGIERSVQMLIERLANAQSSSTTAQSYDDSALRSELSRQATELARLRDMRYTGPSDDAELKALRSQVESLQKSIKEQSNRPDTGGDATALEQQLHLLQGNMQLMREGFEQNIAQLQRESQERPSDTVATELARLQQQLQTQEQLYTQKISTAQRNTRRAVRQQYSNSPTPPPVLSTDNCPDCPAVVETHTRIINRYPQPEQCCD